MAAAPCHPRPPQNALPDHVPEQRAFHDTELRLWLDRAVAGRGHVLFVDAARFVYGAYLCCLWSILRMFVWVASGRQRLKVLGAWDAVARTLAAVANTTVVNTDTMCELLRAVAARGLVGPVTLVLDNARYQRNTLVVGLAKELEIELLFLPSCTPNLNLIELCGGSPRGRPCTGSTTRRSRTSGWPSRAWWTTSQPLTPDNRSPS